jgi:hypothetical protein
VGEEPRWNQPAGESFAAALEHIRSRTRSMRAQITELAVELDGKREELAPLEQVEAELEKMCREAGVGGRKPATGPCTDPAAARSSGGTAGPAAPTRCEQIVALMSQDPERAWRPRDVACGLKDENVKSVRSLLQYLAAKGRLHKNPDASYQVPAANAGEGQAGSSAAIASAAEASVDEAREQGGGSVTSFSSFGRVHPLRPAAPREEPSAGAGAVREQVLGFLRDHANRRWRPRELALEMRLPVPDEVKDILVDLADRGLVIRQNYGRFQYVAPGAAVEQAM